MTLGNVPKLYGYPDMGRTGLGHSLLAWARCAVWCRDAGATMLAPRWARLRIGPYLRRERDKREYFKLFHKGEYVHEPQRGWILLTAARLYAELDLPGPGFQPNSATVVIFRNAMADNEKKMFHLVSKEGPYLFQEFLKIVRPEYVPAPAAEPFIAAHVRMGDFSAANLDKLKAGVNNTRIPVEWYSAVIGKLRERLGKDALLVVISDGPDEALAPLLTLPNARRTPKQDSVTDMLTIAQASALVSSNSGFSRWGSFFGGVPRVCFPGQGMTNSGELEIELDYDTNPPDDFVASLAQHLGPAQL